MKRLLGRRVFLSTMTAGTAAGIWFRYIEPTWFELTHTRIALPGIRPKRLLHISDIHLSDGMTAQELQTGLRAGLAQRPDLICLTGDFVTTTIGFDSRGLRNLLRQAADTAPTYAVLGNHDGGAWLARWGGSASTELIRELVVSTGVRLLHNESAQTGDLTIVGVGDYWSGEFAPDPAFATVTASRPTLLLCHNPDAKEALRRVPWNVMLSGHTHGGQARVPGIAPPWAPVSDKRFISGLYSWQERSLFITRGLGSPKHVRAFCRPEVSIVDVG